MRGETSAGIYEMTVRDPNWERTLKLKVWEKRKEKKTFIRILSPPKEEGIATLKIGFEMWNYLFCFRTCPIFSTIAHIMA